MTPPDDLGDPDPRHVPAEFQYLMIVAVLFALLLLAGLPGSQPRTAGEPAGREPDRAWAQSWSRQAQAAQPADGAGPTGAQSGPAASPPPVDSPLPVESPLPIDGATAPR